MSETDDIKLEKYFDKITDIQKSDIAIYFLRKVGCRPSEVLHLFNKEYHV